MRSTDDDIYMLNYELEVDSITKAVKIIQVEFRRYDEPTQKQREHVDILIECEHVCPICNTSIGVKGMRYTVSGNGLFPSRICHANCINIFNRDGKGIQYNNIVRYLHAEYKRAIEYRDKYWHWLT